MPLDPNLVAMLEAEATRRGKLMDRSQPKAKHQQAFDTAASFHIAAIWNGESRSAAGKVQSPTTAMITNYAFAVELYLKSLLMEANRSTKGHDIEKLFRHLPDADRSRLIEIFTEISGRNAQALAGDIANFGRAFEEWRYMFETDGERPILVFSLAELARACFHHISEKHPDWPDDATNETLREMPTQSSIAVISLGGGYLIRAAVET